MISKLLHLQLIPHRENRIKTTYLLVLCLLSLACTSRAVDQRPADDPYAMLIALERLHGKFSMFAKRKNIHFKYAGLLTRDSDRAGLVKERCGEWTFEVPGIDTPRFWLILVKPDQPSDCAFKIDGITLRFRPIVYGGGDPAEAARKTLGCELAEFESAVQKLVGIEPAVYPD